MPYIGNQHNVGDHVNNFKVLDDISSHTATFDGSATGVVNTTNNTIRVPLHRFIQGQRVTYTNGGGGNIGGLTSGTAYFVSFDSANTIRLATSLANANSNTVINLSSVGSGTSHTLNAAFDGVNKKFKMTYSSGKAARLNNATQLNVAINNVIQRPNIDPNNFTDGFALEDNHKIVFKVAPTVNDVFWGSIIANTIENFDLRDNEVDNFTGNASTTEFTLSTIPANNESVIVTIDGVLQHPSDKNTTRAYTLIDSIIQFTAAPALNAEIQVRHIGFAGASTNDVSGFYGRTGNVALTSSDNITIGDIPTVRNINASGIITATTFDGAFSSSVGGSNANFTGIVTAGVFKGGDIEGRNLNISGIATFAGNVSIGGTLTYEDVTNVDSVGIVTARNGIDCNGDIDVDGHTNLDNVSVAGVTTFSDTVNVGTGVTIFTNGRADFTGFTTFSGGAHIPFGKGLVIGPNSLYGQIGYLSGFSGLQFQALNQMRFSCWDGNSIEPFLFASGVGGYVDIMGTNMGNNGTKAPLLRVEGHAGQAIRMYSSDRTNLTERFKLSQGGFNFTGLSTHTGNFDLNGDLDVDGHTNLDNVSIAGVTTATGTLRVGTGHTFHDNGNAQIAGIATVYNQLHIPRYYGSGVPTGQYLEIGADEMVMYQRWNGSVSNIEFRKHSAFIGHTSSASGRTLTIQSGAITRFGYIQSNGGSGTYAEFNKANSGGYVQLYGTTGKVLTTGADVVNILKDLDVDGHTDLDNVSIAGVSTVTTRLNINTVSNARLAVAGTNYAWRGQFMIKDTTTGASAMPYMTFWDGNEANDGSNTGLLGRAGHVNGGAINERFDFWTYRSTTPLSLGTTGYERLRITPAGQVLVISSPGNAVVARSPGGLTPQFQIEGVNAPTSSMCLSRNSNDGGASSITFNKSRGTSIGSDTVVQNNDTLGILQFVGNDGTDSDSVAAWIAAKVDGTPGSNDMPGRLEFYTTADGASSTTRRVIIDKNGRLSVGNGISADPWSRTGNTNTGVRLAQTTTGYAVSANSNDIVAIFNRTSGTGNGTILELKYDNTVVASLGSTFNSFAKTITIDSNASAVLGLNRANTSSGAVIDFKTNGSVKWYMGLRGLINDNFYIRNEVGSTDAFFINTSGNVAINHTSPTSPLDVKGADSGINIRSDTNDRPHLNFINGSTTMLRISCNSSVTDFGDANSTARYMKLNPESNHSKIRMQAETYVDSSSARSGVYYYGAGFQYTDDQNNDHPVLHVQATSNGGGVNNIVCPNSKIIINGKSIGGSGRSWKLTAIKGSGSNIGQIIHHQTYDVYGDSSKANDYINALSTYTTDNNVIIVTTSDEPQNHAGNIRTTLRDTYGAKDSMYNYFRYAYVFAFRHGFGTLGEQNSIYWDALNSRSGGGSNNIRTIACINFTVCL